MIINKKQATSIKYICIVNAIFTMILYIVINYVLKIAILTLFTYSENLKIK